MYFTILCYTVLLKCSVPYCADMTCHSSSYGMEELLMKYGVDLAIWAHEHSYERLWPVYNETVYNGTADDPYRNPGAPVHIVTGSAVSALCRHCQGSGQIRGPTCAVWSLVPRSPVQSWGKYGSVAL